MNHLAMLSRAGQGQTSTSRAPRCAWWRTALPALLSLIVIGAGGAACMGDDGGGMTTTTTPSELPFTFFLTHYDIIGDPNNLEGLRMSSDGRPFAKAPDGSSIALSGQGAWDAPSKRAQGGGQYTTNDAAGAVTAEGSWRVTGFTKFEMLPGWMPSGMRLEGWQGPTGSPSFSGFLTVTVNLENLGDGELVMWCLMPETPMPGDHTSDGISLTGANFEFTDYIENEAGGAGSEGVMFYGPGSSSASR